MNIIALFPSCLLLFSSMVSRAEMDLAQLWYEGQHKDDGASRDYMNRGARFPWQFRMGDWCDTQGGDNKNQPFTRKFIARGSSAARLNVTELVQRDLRAGQRYTHLALIPLKGAASFHARESQQPNSVPLLIIETDGQKKYLNSIADTNLGRSTHSSQGYKTTLLIRPDIVTLIRFDLSGIKHIKQATLSLKAIKIFGRGVEVNVFAQCQHPLKPTEVKYGIASQYLNDAGIIEHPDVVMADDFDVFWWHGQHWSFKSLKTTVSVVGSDKDNQFEPWRKKALRVKVGKGTHTGVQMGYVFSEEGIAEPEEMYFRYYLRFGDDWAPIEGGKLPGFSGTYGKAGWGGRTSDGYNGWSTRGFYQLILGKQNPVGHKIPLGNYIYHALQKGKYGDSYYWSEGLNGLLDKNRWYSIEQRVKLNDPGKPNGILQTWVDGRQAVYVDNMMYRKTDKLMIERLWMDVYHGGTGRPKQDIHLYIDNVVIARTYIGPMKQQPEPEKH